MSEFSSSGSASASASASATAAGDVPEKEVILVSGDNQEFRVSLKVAKMSELVKGALGEEEEEEEKRVPLPNVQAPSLSKVLEYCNHYQTEPMTEFQKPLQDPDIGILVQEFYEQFIITTNNEQLYNLTLAANYLNIQPLLDLCCARIASFIKGKTPEEIRTNLGIVCDMTEEEVEQIKQENAWADDLP